MRRYFHIPAMLAIGCLDAFLTTRISIVFFILLPILAFVNGYFSSRLSSIICSLLLFIGYSLTLVFETYSSIVYYPMHYLSGPFIVLLILLLIGFLSPMARQNTTRLSIILGIVILSLSWFIYYGTYGYVQKIKIENVYSIYSESYEDPDVELRFTLSNPQIIDTEISYFWSLNDPFADGNRNTTAQMGNPKARVFQGNGQISLKALESKSFLIICKHNEFVEDPRGYVIYLVLYQGTTQVGYYGMQKSTFHWDYSTLPPVKRIEKQSDSNIWIDTFIESTTDGYKAEISDIVVIPPEKTTALSLDNIRVSIYEGPDLYSPLVPYRLLNLISPGIQTPFDLKYFDSDADENVSKGDYLTMNKKTKGLNLTFTSWDNPFVDTNCVGYFYVHEKVNEEVPDAIRIHSVKFDPVSSDSAHLYFEINMEKPISQVNFVYLDGHGHSSLPLGLHAIQNNEYVCDRNIDFSPSHHQEPRYLVIGVSDGTNEVVRLLGILN